MQTPFRRLARFAGAIGVVACLSLSGPGSAAAQPRSGDLLVAAAGSFLDGHVLVVERTGRLWTLARLAGSFPSCVAGAPDNRDVLVPLTSAPHTLVRIAPGGTATSLFPVGERVVDLDLDGRGRLLALAGEQDGRVLALDLGASRIETLRQTSDVPAACAPALDDGAWLIARRDPPPPTLARFDPVRRTVTTLVADLGGIPGGMAADPATGGALVALAGPAGRMLSVTAGGVVSTLFAAPFGAGVEVDVDGTIWLLTQQGSAGRVSQHDRAGRVIRTIPFLALLGSTGLAMYGSRPLHGQGPASPGTTYALELDVPDPPAAGTVYGLAAALWPRPPLLAGSGRRLYLRLDDLFVLSVKGAVPFFARFVGQLDGRGHASASVAVPLRTAGVRLFVSGILLDPTRPGVVHAVLNPWAVTID